MAESGIPADSPKFWQSVIKHSNFKYAATCASACLIVPPGNAIVERIYLLASAVNAKHRNKIIKLQDALVRFLSTYYVLPFIARILNAQQT